MSGFKDSQKSTEGDQWSCSGRLLISRNNVVATVYENMWNDCQLTDCESTNKVEISTGSNHTILTENL